MFNNLTDLVAQASGWAYLIILVLAALDALLPVVPSETAVITAGVVASAGDLSLPLVIVSAAAGAFIGDNTVYLLGHRYGESARRRFFSGEKAKGRIQWAERQLKERATILIIGGRFIPGGRTAVALSAGMTRFPWRRYIVLDGIAAITWALYASLLGYFGGRAFEDEPWKGLILALVIAFAVAIGVEGVRALLKRLRRAPAEPGA